MANRGYMQYRQQQGADEITGLYRRAKPTLDSHLVGLDRNNHVIPRCSHEYQHINLFGGDAQTQNKPLRRSKSMVAPLTDLASSPSPGVQQYYHNDGWGNLHWQQQQASHRSTTSTEAWSNGNAEATTPTTTTTGGGYYHGLAARSSASQRSASSTAGFPSSSSSSSHSSSSEHTCNSAHSMSAAPPPPLQQNNNYNNTTTTPNTPPPPTTTIPRSLSQPQFPTTPNRGGRGAQPLHHHSISQIGLFDGSSANSDHLPPHQRQHPTTPTHQHQPQQHSNQHQPPLSASSSSSSTSTLPSPPEYSQNAPQGSPTGGKVARRRAPNAPHLPVPTGSDFPTSLSPMRANNQQSNFPHHRGFPRSAPTTPNSSSAGIVANNNHFRPMARTPQPTKSDPTTFGQRQAPNTPCNNDNLETASEGGRSCGSNCSTPSGKKITNASMKQSFNIFTGEPVEAEALSEDDPNYFAKMAKIMYK